MPKEAQLSPRSDEESRGQCWGKDPYLGHYQKLSIRKLSLRNQNILT